MPFFNAANLVHATVLGRPVTCQYCNGDAFGTRRIKLNLHVPGCPRQRGSGWGSRAYFSWP